MKFTGVLVALIVTPAFGQAPATHSVGRLSRLIYDARAGGMGGASIAVPGLASAPVENSATLAFEKNYEFGFGVLGDSTADGGLGAIRYFIAGTPDKVSVRRNFNTMVGYGTPGGRDTTGELTVLGSLRFKNLAFFGTKGAIADVNIVSTDAGGVKTLGVTGEGTEYETLGIAYGFKLNRRTAIGISVKEARFYRANIDYSGSSVGGGNPVIVDNSNVDRGLEHVVELSIFHDLDGGVSLGAVVRHANSPLFTGGIGDSEWRTNPSLDLGIAWLSPDGSDLLALDVRDAFQNVESGRTIIKAGWEHRFTSTGPWYGRVGVMDGEGTIGLGWRCGNGSFDVAAGENPAQRLLITGRIRF